MKITNYIIPWFEITFFGWSVAFGFASRGVPFQIHTRYGISRWITWVRVIENNGRYEIEICRDILGRKIYDIVGIHKTYRFVRANQED